VRVRVRVRVCVRARAYNVKCSVSSPSLWCPPSSSLPPVW